ncbi:gastrula zinc finger protein XlCGF8.2DB [Parasteatoda tepidariorum]|uniref:gastrula zinc finger protein XlCGF8.2DB n=1 Tax=Parasteatoda tepidariorum TaxID=114398 RepID=UPI0039BC41A2
MALIYIVKLEGDSRKQDISKKSVSKLTQSKKLFICFVCGYSCNHKGHFERHQGIHTDVRPFACSVCGNRYRVKEHVMSHMRIHAKQKDIFKCPICSRHLASKKCLITHLQKHKAKES